MSKPISPMAAQWVQIALEKCMQDEEGANDFADHINKEFSGINNGVCAYAIALLISHFKGDMTQAGALTEVEFWEGIHALVQAADEARGDVAEIGKRIH